MKRAQQAPPPRTRAIIGFALASGQVIRRERPPIYSALRGGDSAPAPGYEDDERALFSRYFAFPRHVNIDIPRHFARFILSFRGVR